MVGKEGCGRPVVMETRGTRGWVRWVWTRWKSGWGIIFVGGGWSGRVWRGMLRVRRALAVSVRSGLVWGLGL